MSLLAAFALVPAAAFAQPSDFAPPAARSSLDPVRLAADFAPDGPEAPAVVPFEQAADGSLTAPAESIAPVDSLPESDSMPAGPVLAATMVAPAEQPSIVGPIVGALVGGTLGTLAGGVVGYAAIGGYENAHSGDIEDLGAIFLGASVAELFLMPAGAHMGNGGKGSYWSALGGSALGYAAMLGLSFAGPAGTIAGVALQTALTVGGVRLSAKRHAEEQAAGFRASP